MTATSDRPARRGSTGNVIAALCNVFLPGLGHLIQARLLGAALVFVTVSVCYALYWLVIPLIPGALVHLWSIWSAAVYEPRRRSG